MTSYDYHLVDVFTDTPFGGNQLAVFPDAVGMSGEMMQKIARELNLSETTFVLPPEDGQSDFRVRIFTASKEMPMAGHPTVGTAYVLVRLGMTSAPGKVVFQEGVGPIPVALTHNDAGQLVATMSQPMPTFGPVLENRDQVAAMLSIKSSDLLDGYPLQVVSTGVPFLYVPLRDLSAIAAVKLRLDILDDVMAGAGTKDIFVFTPQTELPGSSVHSRMFAPEMGITEDPATGAASGPLGAYLVKYGLLEPGEFIGEQGFEMGRPSLIQIGIDYNGDTFTGIRVGGTSVYIGRGTIALDE